MRWLPHSSLPLLQVILIEHQTMVLVVGGFSMNQNVIWIPMSSYQTSLAWRLTTMPNCQRPLEICPHRVSEVLSLSTAQADADRVLLSEKFMPLMACMIIG